MYTQNSPLRVLEDSKGGQIYGVTNLQGQTKGVESARHKGTHWEIYYVTNLQGQTQGADEEEETARHKGTWDDKKLHEVLLTTKVTSLISRSEASRLRRIITMLSSSFINAWDTTEYNHG